MSKLRDLFDQVSSLVRETPVTPDLAVSNEDRLRMYGLYKQVTVGVCTEKAPSIFSPVERAKHEAWSSYRNLTDEEAMLKYARLASSKENWLSRKIRTLVDDYEQQQALKREGAVGTSAELSRSNEEQPRERNEAPEGNPGVEIVPDETISLTKTPTIVKPPHDRPQPDVLERWFGLKSVVPRGQLDISYRQLAKAASYCLEPSSSPKIKSREDEIAQLWGDNVIVGLSVRSLFDLYLRDKNFAPGSELIVVPPINIPSMLSIIEYHRLTVVGVDLPESFEQDKIMRLDVDQVRQAVTSKTAAIMVVHPFGIETATEKDMKDLRALADDHGLDIIEDCAECYSGKESMKRPYSDIALFSFGTIKTATAMGGGVAVLKDSSERMRRLHQSLYECQGQAEYMRKVLKSLFFRLVADLPIVYGIIAVVCRLLRVDFDHVVSSSTRSFLTKKADFMLLIRRRPSLALVSTIAMRLRHLKDTTMRQREKVQQCEKLMSMLKGSSSIQWPTARKKHNWWLSPIQVSSPETITQRLLVAGYDVPRGLSQLRAVDSCPRAQKLMQSTLYLPVASRSMNESELRNLARAILAATEPGDGNATSHAQRVHPTVVVVLGSICAALMLWAISGALHALVVLLQIAAASVLLKFTFDALLTYFFADLYLESSSSFAKYNPMLRQIFERDQTQTSKVPGLEQIEALKLSPFSTSESSQKQSILITGATGFLGSAILRELLQNDDLMASVEKIVLICRPKRGKSALLRIGELLDQDIFSFLSQESREKAIVVLEGDTSKPNAGIVAKDMAFLRNDLKVHSVINCAASVGFKQSLDEAAAANITSALYLQQLSQRLSAKFVHISTAFVHGGLTGTPSSPLPEALFGLEKFDANRIYRSMLGNQMYANLASSTLDFPNTYTFSKCICEHLLFQRSRNDLAIIRPSIIGPSLYTPFEGWGGQKPSTVIAAACLYLKFPLSIWCFGAQAAAVIPVDVVARFVLAKTFETANPSAGQRGEDGSECSSASGSEYEKIPVIAEVESLSSECSSTEANLNNHADTGAPVIFAAAWNKDSPRGSTFSWFDYATSVPHLGTVLGCFTRITAYIGFAVSLKILPSLSLKPDTFALLYRFLVQMPFTVLLRLVEIGRFSGFHKLLSKLKALLDLPVLFYPFMNNSFCFESELKAPSDMDGKRYMFSCVASAHRFLYENNQLHGDANSRRKYIRDTSNVLVGGMNHRLLNSDFCWAITQPRGNPLIRLVGYLFIKILRSSSNAVSVDVESFTTISRLTSSCRGEKVHIILAPTHRSFYDFVLVSFVAFSLPELQIQIPYIAAAHEFSSLPILGWLIEYAQAFFVRRGRGMDPDLANQIRRIKRISKDEGKVIEVFIEGTRSRDRRFLKGKTGFLRSMEQTGGDHAIVPICISYEKIPEQESLVFEGISGVKRGLRTKGLLSWLWETLSGRLPIGNIHISAGESIGLNSGSNADFSRLALEIQEQQQAMIRVSNYHVQAAEYTLKLDQNVVTEALQIMGCKFWPDQMSSGERNAPRPSSSSEGWSIIMQFGHLIAPKLKESYAHWAKWLSPLDFLRESNDNEADSVTKLVETFETLFDETEAAVDHAVAQLKQLRVCRLSVAHVVQVARTSQKERLPVQLLVACASMRVRDDNPPAVETKMIVPRVGDLEVENEHEQLGSWGFRDSKFQVRPNKKGKPTIVMSGSRYGVSGKPLQRLIPFIESETKIKIDIYNEPPLEVTGLEVDDCELSLEDITLIKDVVSRISVSSTTRMRHGTGHSLKDAYQLRRDGKLRVPDVVVWPSTESEVQGLIELAGRCSWNLIPHGGGTNVSHSTRCPSKATDSRPVISVDMTDIKSILWVNEEDGVAHVQAGITGRELVEEMKHRGYTIGHEPDSLEFSTLGGWIATKASGMKRSKYGNIEDLVVDVRVAGSTGVFWKGNKNRDVANAGRESRGPDLLSMFLGSEGCLGIITSAVIRIWPLPEVLSYESVLLGDFTTGLHFVRSVAKLGPFMPASVRLLDNAHFRLGQALREEPAFIETAAKKLFASLSPMLRSTSSEEVVCATIQFEGTGDEVREQRKQISRIASQHGGMLLGSNIGRSGYELTYVIAYLRDFALSYNFLGDSFETFAPWSKLRQIIVSTKQRIKAEHERKCLPGEVFVGCRVTQLYHEGACVYFYMCMYGGNVNDASAVFTEIEHAARDEILKQGGSLSHHHGVGKIRAGYLKNMDSTAVKEGFLAIKDGLDPSNTFGARNGVFSGSS